MIDTRRALYTATLLSGCVFFLVCAYPHYLRRVEEHNKHQFVIDNHCDTNRPHPSIHYNLMTYDGTATNCAEARANVSMPVIVGAFIDMWMRSPIPGILYATSWEVQIAYMLFGCITIVWGISSIRKYMTDCHVIDVVKTQEKAVAQQRRRLVVDTPCSTPAPSKIIEATIVNKCELKE